MSKDKVLPEPQGLLSGTDLSLLAKAWNHQQLQDYASALWCMCLNRFRQYQIILLGDRVKLWESWIRVFHINTLTGSWKSRKFEQ